LTQHTYETLVSPFIPYAKGPYGYVAPYVAKADTLASDSLTKVDETFPIITKDTEAIKANVMDLAFFPFRLANDGKNYVLDTYGQEYKKCGGDGYVSGGKALLTTGMVVTSDTLAWLSSFLSQKKAEGEDFASAKYNQGRGYAQEASKYANEKSSEAMKFANQKAEQARNLAYEKADEGKDKTKQMKKSAEEKTKQ